MCVRRRHLSTKSHERIFLLFVYVFCPHSLSFVPLLYRVFVVFFVCTEVLCVFAPLLSRSRWFVIWLCGHPVCNAWVVFLCMTTSFCEMSFHLPRVAVLNLCPASVCSMCFVSCFLKLCMSAFTFGNVVCLCFELLCLPSGPTTFFLGMVGLEHAQGSKAPTFPTFSKNQHTLDAKDQRCHTSKEDCHASTMHFLSTTIRPNSKMSVCSSVCFSWDLR